MQGFLFERLQKSGTDEGGGIFSDIKRETGAIRKRARRRAEKRRAEVVGKLAGGSRREFSLEKVQPDGAPAGVAFHGRAVRVQQELIDRVPRKHRELFLAVCRVIESEIESTVSKGSRRKLYEKIAGLLAEF